MATKKIIDIQNASPPASGLIESGFLPENLFGSKDTAVSSMFLPFEDPVLPYEGIFTAFEEAFFKFIVEDQRSFAETLESFGKSGSVDSDGNFLNLSFEELFKVPVTEGGSEAGDLAYAGQEGLVNSISNPLFIQSLSSEGGVVSIEKVLSTARDLGIQEPSQYSFYPILVGPPTSVAPVGNHAPVATDDVIVGFASKAFSFAAPGVLANDTDADPGTKLAVLSVNGLPTNVGIPFNTTRGGIVEIDQDGLVNFDPNGKYKDLAVGQTTTETFTYKATDGVGGISNTSTVTIIVTGVNDAPDAADAAINAVEDGPVVLGTLPIDDVDSDDDANSLITTIITPLGAGEGTVAINKGGTFDFNPGTDFQWLNEGETTKVSFTYKVMDSHGADSTTQTVTITVTGVNDAPVAVDDVGTINEDSTLNVSSAAGVLGNDTDADFTSTRTVGIVNGSAGNIGKAVAVGHGGLFTVNTDGSYVFDTNGKYDYLGVGQSTTETITYQAKDDHGALSNTATLTITINGVNDAPVAVDDTGATKNDTALTVSAASGLKGNDFDPDVGDTFSVAKVNGTSNVGTTITLASGALLTVNADGSYVYDANGKFNYLADGAKANDTFTYQVVDSHGALSNVATATITVTGTNPVDAQNDTVTLTSAVLEKYVLTLVLDISGSMDDIVPGSGGQSRLDIAIEAIAGNGNLLDSYFESSSALHVNLILFRGTATQAFNADVTSISQLNALKAQVESITTSMLTGDTNYTAGIDLAKTAILADNVPAYSNYVDKMYFLTDGNPNPVSSDGNPATWQPFIAANNVDVTMVAIGNPPPTSYTDPLANPTDSPLTISVPDADYASLAGLLSGTVVAFADTVIANDTLGPNIPTTVTSFTYDGGIVGTIGVEVTTAIGSKFTLNADGTYTYKIASGGLNSAQTDTFVYTITDIYGHSDTAVLQISLNNTPPVAANDTGTINEDSILTTVAPGLVANDTDAQGSAIAVGAVNNNTANVGSTISIGKGGLLTVSNDGSYVFNTNGKYDYLAQGQSTTETFTYRAKDAQGALSNTATVTITITGVNDAPTASDISINAIEDGLTVKTVFLGSDVDSDNATPASLTYTIISGLAAGEGTVVNNNDGTFTYNPGADFQALAQGETKVVDFTYKATDVHGADSAVKTVSITVTGVNDAPTANDISINAVEDGPTVKTAFLGSDVDSDNATPASLTYTIISGLAAGEGTVVNNNDGTFTYNPGTNFQSLNQGQTTTVDFTYKATDAHGADSAVKTVTITVTGVNDAPVAVNDTGSVNGNATLTVSAASGVKSNDSDPDAGDTFNVTQVNGTSTVGSAVTLASGALVTVNADGSYFYDTNGKYNSLAVGSTATDSFTYQTTDSHGGLSNVATVTITINGTLVNTPPISVSDVQATNEFTKVTINQASGILSNDSDPDGDTISVGTINGSAANVGASVTLSQGGALVVNADGSYTFDPGGKYAYLSPGQSTTETFTYQAKDSHGTLGNTVTNSIVITGVEAATNNNIYLLDNGGSTARIFQITSLSGGVAKLSLIATLPDTLAGGHGDISNDGTKIYMVGNNHFGYYNLVTNTYVNISNVFADFTQAAFGPDGKFYVSGNGPGSTTSVYTIDLTTGATTNVGGATYLGSSVSFQNGDLTITDKGVFYEATSPGFGTSVYAFSHIPDGTANTATLVFSSSNNASGIANIDDGSMLISYRNSPLVGLQLVSAGGSVISSYHFEYNGSLFSHTGGDLAANTINVLPPVVLDLNHDGTIGLIPVADSHVGFDVNSDGVNEKISWVAPEDGILVYDYQQDGKVTDVYEIAFSRYVEGAITDLQGLVHFDTNHDGKLDAGDAEFSKFSVWQDLNSNGIVDANEMQSLTQRNIDSISLQSDNKETVIAGNTVTGFTQYTTTDGQTHIAGDVRLQFEKTPTNDAATNTATNTNAPADNSTLATNDVIAPQNEIDLSKVAPAVESVSPAANATTGTTTTTEAPITDPHDVKPESDGGSAAVAAPANPAATTTPATTDTPANGTVVPAATPAPSTSDVAGSMAASEADHIVHQITNTEQQNPTGSMG